VFCQLLGDWQYLVKALHLEHKWDTQKMCHLCFAEKSGELNYSNFCRDAPHRNMIRSTTDYLASDAAARSPLCRLPGWHLDCCVIDVMHAGPLGVCLFASGVRRKHASCRASVQ
jgi:hypothetical protein